MSSVSYFASVQNRNVIIKRSNTGIVSLIPNWLVLYWKDALKDELLMVQLTMEIKEIDKTITCDSNTRKAH